MNRIVALSGVLASLWLAGCSLAPEYQRPVMEMPQEWKQTASEHITVQWWQRFEDPILSALVEEAVNNNRDITQAMARVDYARAQLGLARSDQFPTPSVNGTSGRTRSSLRAYPAAAPGHEVNSLSSIDLGASWEIDLWGKYRNLSQSAATRLLSEESLRDGVWLSVAGQTAKSYFLLRAYDSQQETALRTLSTRQEAFKIYSARYEQGLVDELDLLRAKTEVETARSTLYSVRVSLDATESALSALLGRSPRAIMNGTIERGKSLEQLPTVPVFPSDVPSTLLERRPDIRSAEALLQATNFDIGAARAAFFPSISLTGILGFSSTDLDNMFSSNARTWQFGGGLNLPLDYWRIGYNVEGAEALQRQAVAAYEQTVQKAFSEMRDALSQEELYANVVRSLEMMVQDLRKSSDLAKTRYDNGYSSYLEVLDAERSLFQSEMDLATARSNRMSGIVNVCLALGGGWN